MLVLSLAGPVELGTDHAVGAAVVGSVAVVLPGIVVTHFEPAAHLVEPRFVEFVCVLLPGFVFGCVGSD